MPLPGENAMNFKKLPKDKRQKLILVMVGTVLAVAGLYFFLIRSQNQNLVRLASKKVEVQAGQHRVLDAIRRGGEIEADLARARQALTEAEADVASGDLYSWAINTLRQFKAGYKVNIPQFNPLGPTVEVTLLPNFPYKQATMSLAGTAHFHDFGRFLADLENKLPHTRVLNLSVDLNQSPLPEDQETITFKLDIVMLVKPNPA
jgi:hypothetical protein